MYDIQQVKLKAKGSQWGFRFLDRNRHIQRKTEKRDRDILCRYYVLHTRVIEFLKNFEFRNWHSMRGRLMLPDSISEEKLEIDWKMEDLQAAPSGAGCLWPQNSPACRSFMFQPILNFSSEMESGNFSPPLIRCQLWNSKILKNLITLIYRYVDYLLT